MKGKVAILVIFVFAFVLAAQIAPLDAAPVADCSAFLKGDIEDLTSANIDFTCAEANTVYFGACDSGGVPNDDRFNITLNGQVVSYNAFVESQEFVSIGSVDLSAGAHTAVLNSLTTTAFPPATFSYAISSDSDEVSAYLGNYCGTDFGGTGVPSLCEYGPRNVPVFAADVAPSNGTLEFRIMLGNEDSRESSGLMMSWELTAGQYVNNEMVYNLPSPRWARLWWQPEGESAWYLLPSQYWTGDGTTKSEYGIECLPSDQPSYHTAFAKAVPASDVCTNLLEGCD